MTSFGTGTDPSGRIRSWTSIEGFRPLDDTASLSG